MSERRKIIQQLQERITKINEEIEKLIQDRYLHKCTIQELLKKSFEEDDSEEEGSVSDLSIKIITIRKQIKIIQVRE
jgi:chaperonin cofactor prefoldin